LIYNNYYFNLPTGLTCDTMLLGKPLEAFFMYDYVTVKWLITACFCWT